MRAFFQELKANRRRRTAPQRGGAARSGFDVRRPRWDDPMVLTISGHHQPPAAAPSLCSHSRAPPPTTGAGPAARGTRTQDPGPTNSNDHDPTRTKTFARNTAPTPDPTAPTPRPRSASTIDHTTSATTSRREARPHDAQARPLLHQLQDAERRTPPATQRIETNLLHTSRTTAPSNSRRNGAEPDRSRAGTEPISAIAPRGGRPALAPRAGGRGRQRRCQPRPPAPDPLRAQAS